METRAHHILIGFFTLSAGALALLFVLWITRAGTDGDFRVFDVLFQEAVSGLSVGSPVHYSGIRVGEVERLTLDPVDPRQVWARVRVSSIAQIKVDTTARLALLNITGASSIELSQGLPQSPLLAAEQAIPIIEAEPSSLARLRVSSDELLIRVTDLLDRASQILSAENAILLTQVLGNLESFTATMAGQQDSLRAGLSAVADAGVQLQLILQRVDEQIIGNAEPLLSSAATTLANLEQFSAGLNTLLNDNSAELGVGMQSLAQLRPAIEELRGVLGNLNDISSRLGDDPAGFLLGDDNIKEFQP
jgi:phospholipid/cholesterol/gamma-HCH transport system substrate-binding protein